jgi:hypothetical protein
VEARDAAPAAALTGAVTLRAYGRTVGLTGPEPVIRYAREGLPPAYRATDAPAERTWAVAERPDGGGWQILAGGVELSVQRDPVAAAQALLSDLELWVAARARGAVFIHAGAVAVDGRAIVVPGYSMSGKSSLTAALVRAGAEYYSDEFAVLDARGLVRPYARPLSLRLGAGLETRRTAVEELGGTAGRGPAAISLIAAVRYEPATGWEASPVTRSRAALLLLEHTVAARHRPGPSLDALERATAGARALTGTRGEADAAAAHLLGMVSRSPPG